MRKGSSEKPQQCTITVKIFRHIKTPKINKSWFNVNHIPISIPYLEQGYHRNITTVNVKFKWHFDSYNPDQSALHKQKSFPNNKQNTLRILPVRYNIAKGWSTNPVGGGRGRNSRIWTTQVQCSSEMSAHATLKGMVFESLNP